MITSEELGWFGRNPHIWLPPLLLVLFLVGLGIGKILAASRRKRTLAPDEEPAPEPKGPVGREADPAAQTSEPAAKAATPTAEPTPPPPPPSPVEPPSPIAAPQPPRPESEGKPVARERAPVEEVPSAAETVPAELSPRATLEDGLAKTRASFFGRLKGLFGRSQVDENLYEEFEEILITSDVGPRASTTILERLRERAHAQKVKNPGDLKGLLKAELLEVLQKAGGAMPIPSASRPWIVMVTGVNGAGKTTTIGKLAHQLKNDLGLDVILGAADTFRAAATEQLEIWAERVGVDLIKGREGSDPAAVAYDTIEAAKARGADVALIDTAGRLHTKANLMDELKKVKRVMGKALDGAPHEIWIVVDANTGQNAAVQVDQFNQALGLTGIVVTKLDGTAKGGALFGIAEQFGLPIRYAGIGERLGDLREFEPEAFVEALFEEA